MYGFFFRFLLQDKFLVSQIAFRLHIPCLLRRSAPYNRNFFLRRIRYTECIKVKEDLYYGSNRTDTG